MPTRSAGCMWPACTTCAASALLLVRPSPPAPRSLPNPPQHVPDCLCMFSMLSTLPSPCSPSRWRSPTRRHCCRGRWPTCRRVAWEGLEATTTGQQEPRGGKGMHFRELPAFSAQLRARGAQHRVPHHGMAAAATSLQAALLYTNSSGERRIRVHTIAMPVVSGACRAGRAVAGRVLALVAAAWLGAWAWQCTPVCHVCPSQAGHAAV